MQTVTINPPEKIFDDPHFCLDKDSECRFKFRHYNSFCCAIFFDKNDECEIIGKINEMSEKCDQCKDLYQKAISPINEEKLSEYQDRVKVRKENLEINLKGTSK